MFFKKSLSVKCEEGSGADEKTGIRQAERKEGNGHAATCPYAPSVCTPQKRRQRLEKIAFVSRPLTLQDIAFSTFASDSLFSSVGVNTTQLL